MKEIFFFSGNTNKVYEVKNLLKEVNINVLSLSNFNDCKIPKETGSSFLENAIIKSKFGYNFSLMPCLADDSGICISALNKGPGIKSKKFIENSGGQAMAIKKIIKKVREKDVFDAFFQTTLAFTVNGKNFISFTGISEGKISKKAIGGKGFGYDPIFIPKNQKKTFAQMSVVEKNSYSHRGIVLKKFVNFLKKN